MDSKRVLFVSQEIHPYLPENTISSTTLALAKKTNDSGHQVRVFMPRFGVINERRHQLHEVIRLSGMNVVINDMDMPLIIKVASVPGARMQVYFIDNEEYFKRKATYADADGNQFEDNDERTLFFSKGAIDTVEKLGWKPDVIHVHGWMSSLVPMYLRLFQSENPIFKDAKIVFSAYDNGFDGSLGPNLHAGLLFDEIAPELVEGLEAPTCEDLQLLAAKYADVVILGEGNTDHVEEYCKANGIDCIDGKGFIETPEEAIKIYESLLVESDVE
jgi:starch synthase